MDVLVLGNITALSLQIAVLTITGAILHRILGIKAPVIRHAYWRFLLMCCLLLPVIQPWRNLTATDMSESMEFVASTVAITAPASAGAAPSMLATLLREARANWPIWILVALSAGAAILVGVMQRWGFTEALVSETDILDGIVARMVVAEPGSGR